jgi:hypothetical protein
MCVNDCMAFPTLQPKQYRAHQDDRCECCGHKRFDIKTTGSSTRIMPRKVLFWFGVGNVIRDRMFTDPGFCKQRGTGRDQYLYPTPMAARLHQAAGANISDPDTSVYEIGLDWAQMFNSKVHSSGFIMLRCDLSRVYGSCNNITSYAQPVSRSATRCSASPLSIV